MSATNGQTPVVVEDEGQKIQFTPARLPYDKRIKDRFPDVGPGEWRVLVETVWPAARSHESVLMALNYCRVRKLDPFKKPIHIVPIYDKQRRAYVETVWPGISELRTTAFRTKLYAAADPIVFGPDREVAFKSKDRKSGEVTELTMTVPLWAQMTIYRLDAAGVPRGFTGPKVFWLESYAVEGGEVPGFPQMPNAMWRKRPYGQLEKGTEAATLRMVFPDELGNEYAAEEMEERTVDTTVQTGIVIEHDAKNGATEAKAAPPAPPSPPKPPAPPALPQAAPVQVPAGGMTGTEIEAALAKINPAEAMREATRAVVPPKPPADSLLTAIRTGGDIPQRLTSAETGDPVDDLDDDGAPLAEATADPIADGTLYDGDEYLQWVELQFSEMTADDPDVTKRWRALRAAIDQRNLFPPDHDEAVKIAERHADLLGVTP